MDHLLSKEKALGAEIRDSRNRDSEIVRVSTGRRLTPLGESIDHPRTCREDLDFRKEIGAQRNDVNAQFSLCYRLNAGPANCGTGIFLLPLAIANRHSTFGNS